MGIRRKEEIQSDAVRAILSENQSATRGKKKGGAAEAIGALSEEGDIQVDVSLASAINSQFNPEAMQAERAAKVADIKRRVQNGTYRGPTTQELALKFVEELAFEVAEGKNLKERDE